MFIHQQRLDDGSNRTITGYRDSDGTPIYTSVNPPTLAGTRRIIARLELSVSEDAGSFAAAKEALSEMLAEVTGRVESQNFRP